METEILEPEMLIKSSTIDHICISGLKDLDPIDVYFKEIESGKGHVTITCFGSAWTSYWGAMGKETTRQFFAAAGNDYLLNKLSPPRNMTARETRYLNRIVDAVKLALKK